MSYASFEVSFVVSSVRVFFFHVITFHKHLTDPRLSVKISSWSINKAGWWFWVHESSWSTGSSQGWSGREPADSLRRDSLVSEPVTIPRPFFGAENVLCPDCQCSGSWVWWLAWASHSWVCSFWILNPLVFILFNLTAHDDSQISQPTHFNMRLY